MMQHGATVYGPSENENVDPADILVALTVQITGEEFEPDVQQGGTAYVFGSDGRLIDSHSALGGNVVHFGADGPVYRNLSALKQFIAVVAGESSGDPNESLAMAQLMINRMNVKKVGLTSGFFDAIGGAQHFQAAWGNIPYNKVMESSFGDIFSSDFAFSGAVKEAMHALSGTSIDITGGAYFWNASTVDDGFNWRQYKSGVYELTGSYGCTSFFKYSDGRKYP